MCHRFRRQSRYELTAWIALAVAISGSASAENWPRWRGPQGLAISNEQSLPVRWSDTRNVRWRVPVVGTGYSSPIVFGDHVYVTSSQEGGGVRTLWCLHRSDGRTLWQHSIKDDYPEISAAMTGHAASTPVTDGRRVIAFFGNAGAVCVDPQGNELWKRDLGNFDTELGLASSPVLVGEHVYLVCDHDGNRFQSFDSYLIALDAKNGETVWKTDRPDLFRSWSTPVVVSLPTGARELIVNAQDELRAYDAGTGEILWHVMGMTEWVTPSPVFGDGFIFAASGKDGPTLAVRPGGRGNVSKSHVAWRVNRGSPYVCSPLLHEGLLYVYNEQGILSCYRASTGETLYRQRLKGKFTASPVAGDGRIYVINNDGVTFVIAAGPTYRLLAENALNEFTLASPAISAECLFLRTKEHLYCIGSDPTR